MILEGVLFLHPHLLPRRELKKGEDCPQFRATLVGGGSVSRPVSRNLRLLPTLPPSTLQVPWTPRERWGPAALKTGGGDQKFQQTCSSY